MNAVRIDGGRILSCASGGGVPLARTRIMVRHIDLLARLHRIWGGLSLVAGVAILIQAFAALYLILSAPHDSPQAGLAAVLTVTVFFLFAAGAILWGGVHLYDGTGLKQRRPWARLLALGLAVPNLFFLPFGTALAAYAFWVLLSDETRRIFEPVS
jgi:hypothetical protein